MGKIEQKEESQAADEDPLPSMFPPLGSYLDLWDKSLTRNIQGLSLGFLEYPLSVIGSWFGIPITSMALVPLVIVSCMEGLKSKFLLAFCAVSTSLTVGVWLYLLNRGKQERFYGVSKIKLFVAILIVQVACHFISPRASEVASKYLCSYFFTLLWVLWLKYVCKRIRPAHAMTEELKGYKRMLPKMTYLGTLGYTVFESFPSGDAAGGMVASLGLIHAMPAVGLWGYAIAVGASFGRVYFFAHHLLDVSVGCLIAFTCTELLAKVSRAHDFRFGLGHAIVGMVGFIACYMQLVKMRSPVPKQYKFTGASASAAINNGGH